MRLHNQEIIVDINNRYANISYLLDFDRNAIANDEKQENKNNHDSGARALRLELSIDPNAFLSSFEAVIDTDLFIGQLQIKENKTTQSFPQNEGDIDEDIISIKQIYKDIENIFEIRTKDIRHVKKLSFRLKIEQYLEKKLDSNHLTVEIWRKFTKSSNIIQDFAYINFEINISDEHNIYDFIVNNDGMKTKANISTGTAKSVKMSGQLWSASNNTELVIKYKTKQENEELQNNILYDIKSQTFCHVISTKNMNFNYINCNMRIPRRVMFVIDRSLSMKGMKWEKTIRSVTQSIKELRFACDRFGVCVFNNNVKILQSCTSANPHNCDSAICALKQVNVKDQTNFNHTLLQSIAFIKKDIVGGTDAFFMNEIIFVTDGSPNHGENDANRILLNVAAANNLDKIDKYNDKISIFAFGIGDDLNHSFLHLLATNNNGHYQRVKCMTADTVLTQHFSILSKPVLANINIQYTNNALTMYHVTDTSYHALYDEADLIICGKVKGDVPAAGSVEVKLSAITGTMDSTEPIDIVIEMKMDINTAEEENINTDRIWAWFKLRQLMRESESERENIFSFASSLALEYNFLTVWTSIVMVKKQVTSNEEPDGDVDHELTPNINRIMTALRNTALKQKYANNNYKQDIAEMFEEFLKEENFEDDGMEDEFGDGVQEDCSFNDWLKDVKDIDDSQVDDIWHDLNRAFKGEFQLEAVHNIRPEQISTVYDRICINYNINVTQNRLEFIAQQLGIQCPDLLQQGQTGRRELELAQDRYQKKELDRATYSMLQIGKQNHNRPILMFLVDAYNRYRIQRRKRFVEKFADPLLLSHKFKDLDMKRFINDKCNGFSKWLSEYTDVQVEFFRDMCQASIAVFCHRLLPKPPMIAHTTVIDDSIVQIGYYILACYTFIEQLTLQQNAPLPAQIDIVFVARNYKKLLWDEFDRDDAEKNHDQLNEDDMDAYDMDADDDEEKKDDHQVIIGDIEERLKSQKNRVGAKDIEWRKANRKMLESANSLIRNKHNQRIVLIIDRRKKDKNDNKSKDKIYAYQPNGNMKQKCHSFESDQSKFLFESLIQNSRICILPKVNNEQFDVGINHNVNPSCLTLSFHCFSLNEVRVYLFYNGWGVRFFIQDIKYFLPAFFVKNQADLLKYTFGQDMNTDFKTRYGRTKRKCKDYQFEQFFNTLIPGKSPY